MLSAGGIVVDGRRVRNAAVVVNSASGRAGPEAGEEAAEILAEAGLSAQVETPDPPELLSVLEAAVKRSPDLLVLVAGDGTARAAASLCGQRAPLLAPLPGGTMNMLPRALYGGRDWKTALREVLEHGVVREVGGGSVDGEAFYVAAVLGGPALWAEAREAVRGGRLAEAARRARRAMGRTFSGRLRFSINDGPIEQAEALTLITPLISSVLRDEAPALEAATLDLRGAADLFRLAARALAGDWRADPSVVSRLCRKAVVTAAGRIPAVLDGEPVRLGRRAEIRFRPHVFRALALEPEA